MKQSISTVQCTLEVKFISDDDHIYHFDDSWNVTVDNFKFSKVNDDKLCVEFTIQTQLHKTEDDGLKVTVLPHEGLDEFKPELEKLEIILDVMTLHSGIPLAIVDGSYKFRGGGYISSSNPVTNNSTLHDITGLEKRYKSLLQNNDLTNAVRFYRLALIDKEYSGKSVKFWASLEALYKKEREKVGTIWNKLSIEEQNKLLKVIESLGIDEGLREKLINSLKFQKILTEKEMLSKSIKLMNTNGDMPQEDIKNLIRLWSKPRNLSAHGERIKRDDEERQDAVDDLDDTIEILLQSKVNPSMHAYFIGHPQDIEGAFWDTDDHTISKISAECWVKPTQWGLYLLENIGKYKNNDNGPLIYVSHDQIIEISKDIKSELSGIDHLPDDYKKAITKIQEKLNQQDRE